MGGEGLQHRVRHLQRWRFALWLLLLLLTPVATRALAEAPTVTFLDSYADSLQAPIRITLDPSGNAYITEPRRHRIRVLNPSGKLLKTIYAVPNPLGIAVDGQGRLYVGDSQAGSVTLLGPAGNIIGMLGSGAGQFTMPTDIAIGKGGRVYVVDSKENCVKVFDAQGNHLFRFGDEYLVFPTGIAIDEVRGLILVGQYGSLEGGENGARIQVFDRQGNRRSSVGRFGSGEGKFTRIQGLAVDDQGRIYVADCFQSTVQVIDYAGMGLSFIGEFGTDRGQLQIPSDVVLDSYNRLWITSTENGRIELYGIDDFSLPTATTTVAGPVFDEETVPAVSELLPVYPNPGNPGSHIPFRLHQDSQVNLAIYNVAGQLIRRLQLGWRSAGHYEYLQGAAYWDGTDEAGQKVTSGVYFCTMHAGNFSATRRILILR